jgi:ankyrin repeat protein
MFSSSEVCSLLLKAGADPDARNEQGQTSLIRLASMSLNSRRTQIYEILVNAGADVNAANNQNKTALHLLALNIKQSKGPQEVLTVIKVLLQAGASIELADSDGQTPLDIFSLDAKFRAKLDELMITYQHVPAGQS